MLVRYLGVNDALCEAGLENFSLVVHLPDTRESQSGESEANISTYNWNILGKDRALMLLMCNCVYVSVVSHLSTLERREHRLELSSSGTISIL